MTKTSLDPETERVWTDLRTRLFSFIRGRVPTREDAEDVLQEVFARIHESAGRLAEVESVSGWVYRIARNAVVDHHRRRDARERAVDAMSVDPGHESTEPTETAESELAGCLVPLLASLPDAYRRALELTELEGVSQREAAERLGVSVSGMKSRVQRGRAKLRDRLLDCCHVELDRRGGVVDYAPNSRRADCGCR